MPNELFGSVGLALSADQRRPKTLDRRLTGEVRKGQVEIAVGGSQFQRLFTVNLQDPRQVDLLSTTLCGPSL